MYLGFYWSKWILTGINVLALVSISRIGILLLGIVKFSIFLFEGDDLQ